MDKVFELTRTPAKRRLLMIGLLLTILCSPLVIIFAEKNNDNKDEELARTLILCRITTGEEFVRAQWEFFKDREAALRYVEACIKENKTEGDDIILQSLRFCAKEPEKSAKIYELYKSIVPNSSELKLFRNDRERDMVLPDNGSSSLGYRLLGGAGRTIDLIISTTVKEFHAVNSNAAEKERTEKGIGVLILAKVLKDTTLSPQERWALIMAIYPSLMPRSTIEKLVYHPCPGVRLAALQNGSWKEEDLKRNEPVYFALLHDISPAVRWAAACKLLDLYKKERNLTGFGRLCEVIINEPEASVRAPLALTGGVSPDLCSFGKDALPVLEILAKDDSDKKVRQRAEDAIKRILEKETENIPPNDETKK